MVAQSRRITADRDADAPLAGEHLAATQMLVGLIGQGRDGVAGAGAGAGSAKGARAARAAKVPVVQIVGLNGGEGVTTVARSLARSIKAGMGVGIQHVSFSDDFSGLGVERDGRADDGRVDGRADGEEDRLGSGIQRITLPVSAIPRIMSHGLDAEIGARPSAVRLILVETPPLLTSVEGAALSGQVDGTIVVAGADSSTYAAARSGRDVVERAGGRVLGIVLNKRRYRVPGTVARILGIPGSRTGGVRRGLLAVLFAALLVGAFLYIKADDEQRAAFVSNTLPFAVDGTAVDGTTGGAGGGTAGGTGDAD